MTEKEIRQYIAALQPFLKLADWEIRVEIGKCDPDCWAQCAMSPLYRKATIRVSAEILAGNCAENVRAILIHELMHLYTGAAHRQLELLLQPAETDRDRLILQCVDYLIESLIDPVSEVIESIVEVSDEDADDAE